MVGGSPARVAKCGDFTLITDTGGDAVRREVEGKKRWNVKFTAFIVFCLKGKWY